VFGDLGKRLSPVFFEWAGRHERRRKEGPGFFATGGRKERLEAALNYLRTS